MDRRPAGPASGRVHRGVASFEIRARGGYAPDPAHMPAAHRAHEDLDFKTPCGLDRSLVLRLASGQWIRDGQTVLVSGATGTGKSYVACALGYRACRFGISTRYYRVSRLFDELTLARGDGSYPEVIRRLARTRLLILADWGLASLSGQGRHDLLEGPRRPLRSLPHPARQPGPRRSLARCRRRPDPSATPSSTATGAKRRNDGHERPVWPPERSVALARIPPNPPESGPNGRPEARKSRRGGRPNPSTPPKNQPRAGRGIHPPRPQTLDEGFGFICRWTTLPQAILPRFM